MTTVAAYKAALERVYTLIGKPFSLVVIAVNPHLSGSGAPARELLLVARSMSSEAPVKLSRQVINGPVVRYDLLSEESSSSTLEVDLVTLNKENIMEALAGRRDVNPLIMALVGVSPNILTCLSAADRIEKPDLAQIVTGGYLVLSFKTQKDEIPTRLSVLDLCLAKKGPNTSKFLLGNEEIVPPTRSLSYAIRLQAVAPPQRERILITPEVAVVRTVRAPRWQRTVLPPPPSEEIKISHQQPSSMEWEKKIQGVVRHELSKLLPTAELVTIHLGDDGLTLRLWPELVERISMAREWMTVFTHQSVDPIPRANYEAFETLGDKVLSLSLVHYLFSDNSKVLDSNGLTDSHKEILSSVRQAVMAVTMGLNQSGLIRSSVSIDDKMLEDVHEAFFGCLFTVGNRIIDGGNQGLPLCEALFKHILHESFPSLDPWSVPKDPQTTLDQIFIRLGWGHPVLNYNEDTRITTIRLTRDAQTFLENMMTGIKISDNRLLATGPRAADKPSSARAAAEIALASLKLGWGIDSRYASMVVRSRLMKDERYASVQREALKIAERMGYTDIYVARRAKNHNQLYAVMGVKPDDSEFQLHIYKYESPEIRGDVIEDSGLSTRVAAYITALKGFIAAHRR